LTRERLLFELKKQNINVINTAKRDGLVKELELGLANETEMIQDGKKRIYKKKKKILKQNANYYLFGKRCFRKSRKSKYYMVSILILNAY
jgi:hypothetical protein